MKIFNVRNGLATNSSSTHSLILIPPGTELYTDETESFGWQNFTAASVEAKTNYLAAILHNNLYGLIGESNASAVVQGLFDTTEETLNGLSVDHQSSWVLPVNWNGKGIDLEFFEALKQYILRDEVVILGGNDNYYDEDDRHPLRKEYGHFYLPLPQDGAPGDLVARKDKDHWVLFNRDNGGKIRFAFEGKTETVVTKATTPELIDIKITDFCPFGCQYCYQASTQEGKHGEDMFIKGLAYNLSKMKVFEVAIGGGEPTLHPNFLNILETFRSHNVVPNFTTKNLAWIKSKDNRKIMDVCGAFAYSVESALDVDQLVGTLQTYGYSVPSPKISIQYVLGGVGKVEEVLAAAVKHNIRITLLGFKTTGFGATFPQVSADDNWIEAVKTVQKGHYLNLGVDTAIIQKWGDAIVEKMGVSSLLFTAEEGKFSCYIDAVAKTMAPSSYSGEAVPLPLTSWGSLADDKFVEIFSKF